MLLSGNLFSPEGLSALFVAVLLLLTILFAVMSVINYLRARRQLRFYRKLLKGMTGDQLIDQRRDLVNNALKNRAYGRLWREFDESLVHVPHKQRLCNTLDAAHFFNTHTIARGLTENRMLAAVPGFLTAIGVIGTFVGLQLGLGSLSALDPANANVDDMTHGIFGMIGGASIAFMTSVWGVFTSVLFNFFEKFLERNIRSSINAFQNEVDYLYPRITAEQSLSNIEDFTRQSNDRLAELDEKIGHKMQEAMREASGVISESVAESLNSILAPAIERLVDTAHSGSEKALDSLLGKFLDGVGDAGNAQRSMMEDAAKRLAEASGGMTAGLAQFTDRLDSRIQDMVSQSSETLGDVAATVQQEFALQKDAEQKRQQAMSASMNDFVATLSAQVESLATRSASTMETVQADLSKQIEDQRDREISRQQVLHDQLTEFRRGQAQLSEGIEGVLATQQQQNISLTQGLDNVLRAFSALSESNQQVTQTLQQVASDIRASSNQLGLLSANVKTAADSLGDKVSTAADNVAKTAEENATSLGILQRLTDQLQLAGERIDTTANTMNSAADKAESGLSSVDRHFTSLTQSLNEHVQQLERQVANLLNDYSERVSSQTGRRMDEWNEQTNRYITAMTNAVQVLNGVVDEIDGKIRDTKTGASV